MGNNCLKETSDPFLINKLKEPLNEPQTLVKAPNFYFLLFQRSNDNKDFL